MLGCTRMIIISLRYWFFNTAIINYNKTPLNMPTLHLSHDEVCILYKLWRSWGCKNLFTSLDQRPHHHLLSKLFSVICFSLPLEACSAVWLLLLFRFPPMSPSITLCVCCREQTWWRWVWLAQQCKKYFRDGCFVLTRRRDRKRGFNRSCWTSCSAWGVFLSWFGFKKLSSIYADASWTRRRKFFSQAKVMSFLGLWCNSNLILYIYVCN